MQSLLALCRCKCHDTIKQHALKVLPQDEATWHALLTGLWCALQEARPVTPWAAQATARTMTATQSMATLHMCVPLALIPANIP